MQYEELNGHFRERIRERVGAWAAMEIDERTRLTLERTRQFEALLARDLQ